MLVAPIFPINTIITGTNLQAAMYSAVKRDMQHTGISSGGIPLRFATDIRCGITNIILSFTYKNHNQKS